MFQKYEQAWLTFMNSIFLELPFFKINIKDLSFCTLLNLRRKGNQQFSDWENLYFMSKSFVYCVTLEVFI